jgi:NADPH-dependent glutamate synthase beta subunit-like oxidoreductase
VTGAPQHAVAVVGGATAGAEAAGMLAARGVLVVVFEQNPRPYGKIEDGLPRWHVKLRKKEYETINAKLDRPGVHFVPNTKIGRDLGFAELVGEWGFNAVVLAHGAWRDRPLDVPGAEDFVGRGLVYQNDFIYWFNHFQERAYQGPQYTVTDGAIVVGGGLASLDVMKVLQIELVREALAERGIDQDELDIEAEGIPAVLEEHGLTWDDLGLAGATLYYRRRIEDMPLAEIPDDADDEKRHKYETTRRRILEKAMQKYCFQVRPQRVPVAILRDGDTLAGLRFQRTKVEDGRPVPIPDAFEEARAPLVISSIGSVPEPMTGIEQRGLLYHYTDPDLGRLGGYEHVFSTGNVVTGKGNIIASRRHSTAVTGHVLDRYLGVPQNGPATAAQQQLAEYVDAKPGLTAGEIDGLLARVRARQEAVGYTVPYKDWLARVTPPDLA